MFIIIIIIVIVIIIIINNNNILSDQKVEGKTIQGRGFCFQRAIYVLHTQKANSMRVWCFGARQE